MGSGTSNSNDNSLLNTSVITLPNVSEEVKTEKKEEIEKTYIYILELQDNKWYVGKTQNIEARILAHQEGKGSCWTSRYSVIRLAETIVTRDPFDEDKYVKKYMAEYGIENVRGGSYSQINLDASQVDSLRRELKSASNLCYGCGKGGHYVKECPDRQNRENKGDYGGYICYRCGRRGHMRKNCYARTKLNGEIL